MVQERKVEQRKQKWRGEERIKKGEREKAKKITETKKYRGILKCQEKEECGEETT